MSATLGFWFDFSSPFAYLGSTQVRAVAARHGAKLEYRPFLLGGLFKAIGTPDVPFFAMSPPRQRHFAADMARWADHWSVPFSFPSRFPMNTVKPLRMVLDLADGERGPFVHAMFEAYWARDRDLTDDAVLAEIARGVGLDGARLVERTRDADLRDRLRAATQEAEAAGVCGAPCFVVGDQLFWGQDRLVFVDKALAGWRVQV